jgi:hypothetical protein
MRALDRIIRFCLISLVVLLPLGCAFGAGSRTSPVSDKPAGHVGGVLGMRQVAVPDAVGMMFVRPPGLDVDQYHAYVIETPLLHFRKLSGKPTRGESIRLSRVLADETRAGLERALGWREVAEPGPGIARVQVQASHINFSSPDSSSHTRTTALVSTGSLIYFMLEIQDSESRLPLLRYGIRRPLPGGTFTGPYWHEIDRARLAFRSFGRDMRPSLESLAN